MSRFSGPKHERPPHLQSMKTWRAQKRKEAEERNAATPPERRAAYRREAQARIESLLNAPADDAARWTPEQEETDEC